MFLFLRPRSENTQEQSWNVNIGAESSAQGPLSTHPSKLPMWHGSLVMMMRRADVIKNQDFNNSPAYFTLGEDLGQIIGHVYITY